MSDISNDRSALLREMSQLTYVILCLIYNCPIMPQEIRPDHCVLALWNTQTYMVRDSGGSWSTGYVM